MNEVIVARGGEKGEEDSSMEPTLCGTFVICLFICLFSLGEGVIREMIKERKTIHWPTLSGATWPATTPHIVAALGRWPDTYRLVFTINFS